MIKNRFKLSLVAAMITTTCSYAGTVTAPNSMDIKLGGEIKIKHITEKTNAKNVDKRTAEVDIKLESKLKNGIKIFTTFTGYDDSQAGAEVDLNGDGDTTDDGERAASDANMRTKEAYVVIPLMDGKGKIIAGLAPNKKYGTYAFDNGGESWKIAVNVPVVKGVNITVVSKIKNEEEQDSNKGDSGATAIRIDAKIGTLMVGAKYAQGYANKNNGKVLKVIGDPTKGLHPDDTEKEVKGITAYLTGKVSGFKVGAEYIQKDVTFVGANKTIAPSGYFITASKKINNLTTGIAYLDLTKGMKGGEDFTAGLILDGNINSSSTKDTSAIIVPIDYKINEKLTANLKLIKADILETNANEIDLGMTYKMDKNIKLKVVFGKYSHTNSVNDQTNTKIELAIKF